MAEVYRKLDKLPPTTSAISRDAAAEGFLIAAEFAEVETGKRSDRPQLAAAMALAKARKATLLVAKLDR